MKCSYGACIGKKTKLEMLTYGEDQIDNVCKPKVKETFPFTDTGNNNELKVYERSCHDLTI